MRQVVFAAMITLILLGSAPAQAAKGAKDTVGASGGVLYSPPGNPVNEEGAFVDIGYKWSLTTHLGEPILKCGANWKLKGGVYVRKYPDSAVEYIAAQDMPPSVASSIRIVDLDIGAHSYIFLKSNFTCDTGVVGRASKEMSFNTPVSPSWDKLFDNFGATSVAEAKSIFKGMLANSAQVKAPGVFQYSVRKIAFDLSGVRDWLRENEKKKQEEQIGNAFDELLGGKSTGKKGADKQSKKKVKKTSSVDDAFSELARSKGLTGKAGGLDELADSRTSENASAGRGFDTALLEVELNRALQDLAAAEYEREQLLQKARARDVEREEERKTICTPVEYRPVISFTMSNNNTTEAEREAGRRRKQQREANEYTEHNRKEREKARACEASRAEGPTIETPAYRANLHHIESRIESARNRRDAKSKELNTLLGR